MAGPSNGVLRAAFFRLSRWSCPGFENTFPNHVSWSHFSNSHSVPSIPISFACTPRKTLNQERPETCAVRKRPTGRFLLITRLGERRREKRNGPLGPFPRLITPRVIGNIHAHPAHPCKFPTHYPSWVKGDEVSIDRTKRETVLDRWCRHQLRGRLPMLFIDPNPARNSTVSIGLPRTSLSVVAEVCL